jgi:hypothetical protein
MRIIAFRELLVRSSGAKVKAQIWERTDGIRLVWLDSNWYPMGAFDVL